MDNNEQQNNYIQNNDANNMNVAENTGKDTDHQAFQYQQNSYGPVYQQEPTSHQQNSHQQNSYQQSSYQQSYHQEEKEEKKGSPVVKIIVSAVVFGLLAAICFKGVNIALNQVFPSKGGQIQQVETSSADTQIQVATGGAIKQVSDVSGIVNKVMPSIVSITQTYTQKGYSLFGGYYEDDAVGSGSGFIVSQDDKEILVVTNNHVVAGAKKIKVTFIDEQVVEATVKGTDSMADLAVLSVKLKDIKDSTKKEIRVSNLGESDDVKVGQMAIAIGNALGYGQSVTVGYISAKDREVSVKDDNSNKVNKMKLLQTDAAINPGNSGGALLDINGNVIGINSMKYASNEVEGMGYAIPMSKAVPIINELMKREVLTEDEKGYLGISGRTISEDVSKNYGMPAGVYVVEVSKDGSAKAAGVQVGDVITKINDVAVSTIDEVKERVNSYRVGTELTITVKRSSNGVYEEKVLKCTLKGKNTIEDLQDETEEKQDSKKEEKNNNGVDGYDKYDDDYDRYFGGDDDYDGGDDNSQTLPWGDFFD